MIPDLVNAAFEGVGCFACWRDVAALHKAKRAVGVHWQSRAFFAAWGAWNLYYYANLNQWASWLAGVGIAVANAAWVALYMYHRNGDAS